MIEIFISKTSPDVGFVWNVQGKMYFLFDKLILIFCLKNCHYYGGKVKCESSLNNVFFQMFSLFVKITGLSGHFPDAFRPRKACYQMSVKTLRTDFSSLSYAKARVISILQTEITVKI